MAFVDGFLIGLATIVFWGPVFFTLLNGTLQFGFKAGIVVSCGILFSDIVAVVCCYFASPIVMNGISQFWLTLTGAMILLGLGLKYIIQPIKIIQPNLKLKNRYLPTLFLKGFMVNFSSPFTFAYWMASVSYGRLTYTPSHRFVWFMLAILSGIFLIDLIKVMLSGQIKRLLKPSILRKISILSGIILIGFSIRFVWHLFTMQAD